MTVLSFRHLTAGLACAALITSLAWAQPGTTGVAPGPAAVTTPFQGLYLELRPVGGSLAAAHYYFWKDGRYCEGLPAGGLEREPADFEALKAQLSCGRYGFSRRALTLTPQPEGPSRSIRVDTPDGRLSFDDHLVSKAPLLMAPAGLQGTYTAIVMGSMTTRQTYVFRADGSYLFTSAPLSADDGSPVSISGQYKAVGQLLQLSDSSNRSGSVSSLTAYPYPTGGLMVEGTVFSR